MDIRKNKKQASNNKRFTIVHLTVLIAVVAIVVFFTLLTLVVYRAEPSSRIVRTATSILPYPAAVVNGDIIWMDALSDQYTALDRYYSTTGESFEGLLLDGENAVTNIVDNLIRKMVLMQLGDELGLEVTEDEIEAMMQEVIDNTGTPGEAEEQIAESFGWSLGDFKKNVITPLVLATKVEETILTDAEAQAEKMAKINEALEKVRSGENFAEVAEEYSEDASAADGGHLGFVSFEQLPETWGKAIGLLAEGETTDVVETSHAYGIFLVNNIVEGEFNLYLIGVQKVGLEEAVNNAMAEASVWRFIGEEVAE